MKISEKQAVRELYIFITNCSGDDLAALYETVFGNANPTPGGATWNEAENCIDVDP